MYLFEDVLAAIQDRNIRKINDTQYTALCPSHNDSRNSLSVGSKANGDVLIRCHAGCDWLTVVNDLGVKAVDEEDIVYTYTDEQGEPLFEVVRQFPKNFYQRKPDGTKNVEGVRKVLYSLPNVLHAASYAETVWVVEGEKDADRITIETTEIGTTSPGGAEAWKDEYADYLIGASQVFVVADDDEPGKKHARRIADSLKDRNIPFKVLIPPFGKDVSDFFDLGGQVEDLLQSELNLRPAALSTGAEFLFTEDEEKAALWGFDNEILWASGEPCLIVGPSGVGKTTLTIQLVLSAIGFTSNQVLGYPLDTRDNKVLYLASDRPQQIKRAFKRLCKEDKNGVLENKLVIWKGPPPADIAKNPKLILDLARSVEANIVVLDSLKDMAEGIEEGTVAQGLNKAIQYAVANGIEILEVHHQIKSNEKATRPKTLDSIYGSTWITAGVGSVLLLWGEAGDTVVKMYHLKQPAERIGPLDLEHDHKAGTTSVIGKPHSLESVLSAAGDRGLDLEGLAKLLYDEITPTKTSLNKTKKRLESLIEKGRASQVNNRYVLKTT